MLINISLIIKEDVCILFHKSYLEKNIWLKQPPLKEIEIKKYKKITMPLLPGP